MFTDPVVGKDFFGRHDVLQLLLKRAHSLPQGYRQNIAVLGPELIGKSSLLQQFMLRFNDPKTVVVYVALRSGESFDEFSERFTTLYGHALLKKTGKESGASELKTFFDKQQKLRSTERFNALLEFPRRIWKETGQHTILILDEFDKLLELGIEEPFAHLGKQIMIQKETMYLLASSNVPFARLILRQRLSLLFGHFEVVTLEPFSPKSALTYLERRWHLTFLDIGTKQFLITLTGGHPFYLNVIGETLSASPPSESRNPTKSVISVLEKLLFNAHGILNQYLLTRLNHGISSDHTGKSLAILLALAKRAQPEKGLRSLFKNSKDIGRKLTRLLDTGLIMKNGSFYRIQDRLFAFWLTCCYTRKTNIFSGNISEQSLAFRKDAEETLKRFTDDSKKGLPEKITDLFKAFNGETVEIDQKRHRLPCFTDLQCYNGRKGNMTIVGNKKNGNWISAFFEYEVTEEDISNFLKQSKQIHQPISQRILVPLNGMNDTARLLAKKEKLWTWEDGNINMLLDLFGYGPLLIEAGDAL